MADLFDLWRALEVVPGLAATKKEWQIRTGDGFSLLEPMLRPIGGVAECMPCFSSRLGLHYHDVVEHRDGTTEAILKDKYRDCRSFPVERHERAIMTPDMEILGGCIADAMGFERIPPVIDILGTGYEIGRYHPIEALKIPVILSLCRSTVISEESILSSIAVYNSPFIFLRGTPKPIRGQVEALIAARCIFVGSLSECLGSADDRTFQSTSHWVQAFEPFRRKVTPKLVPAGPSFRTPPNTGWANVSIRFIDSHFVEVEAGGASGRFNYTEMDMANHRVCKPSRQWEFLEQIAENHRVIDFHMGDSTKNKSWKYELSTKLRRFFGIDDDPFWPYDPKTGSWEAKFNLIPQGDV